MEEKKVSRISLSTVFFILSLIVIMVMSIFMFKLYNEKVEITKQSADLQTQVDTLNKTVSAFQEKIDNISNILSSTDTNTSNNTDKTIDSNVPVAQLSTEDTIKKLFLEKLSTITAGNVELGLSKIVDYRVDKVEISKEYPIESVYQPGDILAYVTYSIKPENNPSAWLIGNGDLEGEWIVNKVSCEYLRDGKLLPGMQTGW